MKKLLMLTAAFAMTGMMASCGGEEEEEESDDKDSKSKTTEAPADRIGEAIDVFCACTELSIEEMEPCLEDWEKEYADLEDNEEAEQRFEAEAKPCIDAMKERVMASMNVEEEEMDEALDDIEEDVEEEMSDMEGGCEEGACQEGACGGS